jgi:YHS domain-containing protein
MDALIYFALWAGFIVLMMRLGCGAHVMGRGSAAGVASGGASGGTEGLRWIPPETDVDPVCGRTVKTAQAKPSVHDGTVFYFCSRDCREIFEAAPELYPRSPDGRIAREEAMAHG